jgi:hypothetical protein
VSFRRTREITIQTTDTVSIRLDQVSDSITCQRCGVPLLAPEAVAKVLGLSLRGIYRAVEARRVHFRETATGRLLVCPSSLQNLVQSGSADLK